MQEEGITVLCNRSCRDTALVSVYLPFNQSAPSDMRVMVLGEMMGKECKWQQFGLSAFYFSPFRRRMREKQNGTFRRSTGIVLNIG